jgi:hypothetical protein
VVGRAAADSGLFWCRSRIMELSVLKVFQVGGGGGVLRGEVRAGD